MANHAFRSAVVLVLLLGTLALAVPYVSSTLDRWLFAEGNETEPQWNANRPPSTQPPQPLKPTSARPLSIQTSADESALAEASPFAFEFQEEAPKFDSGNRQAVQQAKHAASANPPHGDLVPLQRELQELGAAYLVVEELEADVRYECRCLMPLAAESVYQKAFSGIGSSPRAALEQVVAEVRAWKASQRR